MSDRQIRECRQEESETVVTLWQQVGTSMSITSRIDDLQHTVAENTALPPITGADSSIVSPVWDGFDDWLGNIYRSPLHPSHQRLGIAPALVAQAEKRLAQQGERRM